PARSRHSGELGVGERLRHEAESDGDAGDDAVAIHAQPPARTGFRLPACIVHSPSLIDPVRTMHYSQRGCAMRDQQSVHTVARALDLLAGFDQDHQELAVREFAALLGVHKSTASRLAATLVSRGFLQRVAGSDTFRLGPEAA